MNVKKKKNNAKRVNLLFRQCIGHHVHDLLLVAFTCGLWFPVEVDITSIPDLSIIIHIRDDLDGMTDNKKLDEKRRAIRNSYVVMMWVLISLKVFPLPTDIKSPPRQQCMHDHCLFSEGLSRCRNSGSSSGLRTLHSGFSTFLPFSFPLSRAWSFRA